MLDKKFWQKAFKFLLVMGIVFFTIPQVAQATKTFGLVGIESRVTKYNLMDYTTAEGLNRPPLIYAQDIFEDILTTGFQLHGLESVDKTDNARLRRSNEIGFQQTVQQVQQYDETRLQQVQKILSDAISALEKKDIPQAIKIFTEQPDYIIYGYIANLTMTHRESIATSNIMAKVLLTARVIDSKTGKIICVATGEGTSSNHGGAYRKAFKIGGESISEDSWHEAVEKASDQILSKIQKRI